MHTFAPAKHMMAGYLSWFERMIHNHEVAGSIPAPATKDKHLKMKDLEEIYLSGPFAFLLKND